MKRRRINKLLISMITVVALSLTACGSTPKNTVFSKKDLAKKTIGVQLGTTGDTLASEYEKKEGAKVERFNKGADAIQALKQGKVDCVIIDNSPAKVFAEKNDDLKVLKKPLTEEQYAICLKKGNRNLTTKVNNALKILNSKGILSKIIDNYIGDNKGKTPYKSPTDVKRNQGKLVMATNAEFPPYESKKEDKVVGIDADIAQAISDQLGMELEIEDMAFDSIIPAVQSGKADIGVAGMTVTKDRLKNVEFTNSYTTAAQVIVVRKK